MQHVIIPPPPALAHVVKCFWSFETHVTNGDKLVVSTFVNDSTGMTFVLDRSNPLFRATVEGQSTRPRVYTPVASMAAMGVQFHTGALPKLFGFDAYSFLDQEIPLGDVYTTNITERLIECTSLEARIFLLSEFLLSLCSSRQMDPLILTCLDAIRASDQVPRVSELLAMTNVSERTLERRFLNVIGVSPRHFLGVARFQRTLRHLRLTPEPRLTEVFHNMGYYDQPHFSREVRRFSGHSPSALHRKLMKHPVNQTGSTSYLVEITS